MFRTGVTKGRRQRYCNFSALSPDLRTECYNFFSRNSWWCMRRGSEWFFLWVKFIVRCLPVQRNSADLQEIEGPLLAQDPSGHHASSAPEENLDEEQSPSKWEKCWWLRQNWFDDNEDSAGDTFEVDGDKFENSCACFHEFWECEFRFQSFPSLTRMVSRLVDGACKLPVHFDNVIFFLPLVNLSTMISVLFSFQLSYFYCVTKSVPNLVFTMRHIHSVSFPLNSTFWERLSQFWWKFPGPSGEEVDP